jgi:3-dehydroquinate synthase class II
MARLGQRHFGEVVDHGGQARDLTVGKIEAVRQPLVDVRHECPDQGSEQAIV